MKNKSYLLYSCEIGRFYPIREYRQDKYIGIVKSFRKFGNPPYPNWYGTGEASDEHREIKKRARKR